MIKKLILLGAILIVCTSCSEFALLTSGSSLAISQNSYTKIYNTVDFLTVITTDKSINNHIYEKRIHKGRVETIRRPR